MEAKRESSGEYQRQELKQAIANQGSFCIQCQSFIPTSGLIYTSFFHASLSLVIEQQEDYLLFFSSILIYTYWAFVLFYVINIT